MLVEIFRESVNASLKRNEASCPSLDANQSRDLKHNLIECKKDTCMNSFQFNFVGESVELSFVGLKYPFFASVVDSFNN